MLVLQRFCIRRGREPVVQHASLRVENPGLLFVVGTGGAGKSSLLAVLAGAGARQGLTWAGVAELAGKSLPGESNGAVWVAQHCRLPRETTCGDALAAALGMSRFDTLAWLRAQGLAEVEPHLDTPTDRLPRQLDRLLAVLAGLYPEASLYLVDEPTADLDDAYAERVRDRLSTLSRHAMTIVATHNRLDCLALGGHTALLAGGSIQECSPSARFFAHPATRAGQTYVETGNCNLPRESSMGRTRCGIWWIVPGLLCGMSRPGLMGNAESQYRALASQGVRHLLCLEERCHYPLEPVRAQGIEHRHFPVQDMAAPGFAQAVDLCRAVELPIRNNEGVALHCRGGLGRTGTAAAVILAWFGDAAEEAIGKVRRANPLAIQSMAQVRFLHEFADRIRGWHQRDNPTQGEIRCP